MTSRIINGVFGLAIRPDFSVLLSQRYDPTNPRAHLKWQISGGGQEYGESLIQTLHRELKEELGLSKVVILDEEPLIRFSLWEEEEPKTHVNMFIYCIDINDQVPTISDDESTDWKWFTLDEVSSLDTLPQTHEYVAAAIQLYTQQKSA